MVGDRALAQVASFFSDSRASSISSLA